MASGSTDSTPAAAAAAGGAGAALPPPPLAGAVTAMAAESSDSDDEVDVKQYKVIVLGDGAVGKTSMLHRCAGAGAAARRQPRARTRACAHALTAAAAPCRFSSDTFGKMYKQTIGVDFFMKRVELPGPTTVLLQCWDIGGQTIGSKMLRSYIFGAHAVVLAYDITNAASFADLEDWLSECRAVFKDKMPALALVGNKSACVALRACAARAARGAMYHAPLTRRS